MDTALSWLEALPPAEWIRTAVWPFPVFNILHVIGIALLFGGIAVLDLRLFGAGDRALAISPLARMVLPLAAAGFALAVGTGLLMFMASPRDYWANPYFSWKLGFIGGAATNALLLHLTTWPHPLPPVPPDSPPSGSGPGASSAVA